MGCGASKSVEQLTADLWTIIQKQSTVYGCDDKAARLIRAGADVRVQKNGQYMIDDINEQIKRNRQAARGYQADQCQKIGNLLRERASALLLENIQRECSLDQVKLLHKLGADTSQKESLGALGLIGVAVKSNNATLPLIQFLYENNAECRLSITVRDNQGSSVLSSCQDELIKKYIHHQLNLQLTQVPQQAQISPDNKLKVATTMLEIGATPDFADEKGNTILINATYAGNLQLVQGLTALGCSLDVQNGSGMSPLDIAENAAHKDPLLIAFLKTSSVNKRLRQLITSGNATFEAIQQMVTEGADINFIGPNKDTPLHLCVKHHVQPDTVDKVIHTLHANVDAVNEQGYRPIESCIVSDESLTLLPQFVSLPNLSLFSAALNRSILLFAREQNRPAAVELIQVELNKRLWTCLCAMNPRGTNNATVIAEATNLLQLGADVNAPHSDEDYEAWTPFALTCKCGNLELVKFLLEKNADFTKLTGNETSPVALAASAGQLAIVQHLRTLGDNLNTSNQLGQTALYLATLGGHYRVVRYLVLWGAIAEMADSEGRTPLDIASQNASVDNQGLIDFLQQLQPTPEYTQEYKAMVLTSSDVDVCIMGNLLQVPALKHVGVEDEDPLGEKSSGMLSTKPNTKLRKAAKKGDISDARAAVAEGADVRHVESGETAYDVAMSVYRENVNKSGKDWKETQKYRSLASNTKEVADYLVNVATAKLTEAILQGHEGRVRAFHVAHGIIDSGDVISQAAIASDSVALMDYLVNNSQTNFQRLWSIDGNQSAMEKARAKNHHNVAAYIEGRLSQHFSNVIVNNDLSLLRALHRAGALVDFTGCNNMVVGISTGNVELVKFLFEQGCRVEEHMYAQATPQIKFYLKYAIKGRDLRKAASKGDLAILRKLHAQGADLNARNCYGATALSMCIQHGPFISCIHYLVSRGASLLHKDARIAPSLIQYAKSMGAPYEVVRSYLARELNIEFLEAVVENDMDTCEALGRLGADFNYQDRHGRTCLHLATKYQGVDTIQWLVERGCLPTTPDSQGEYAITLAAVKGDYAAVKYLTTHNAGTKNLTNPEGLNALEIAKKYRYNHIVQLLDPGNKDYPVDEKETASGQPKYDIDTLVRASRNGHLSVVQEFIDERYASLALKTEHCKTMLQEAARKQQSQIVTLLKAHYASLTSQVASDQTADRLVGASAQQKAILQGLLNGLAGLLSGSEIALDPTDPNTYTQLFSNLSQNVQQRGSELSKLHSPQDVQRQVSSDTKQLEIKLAKIQQDMEQMNKSKENLEKRLQATEANLKVAKNALEKKNTYKELEEVRGEMAALACSVSLITSIQESTEAKRKVLASIKQEPALYYFYSTIENRVQALLVACATASTGMFTQQQSNSVTVLQLAGKAVSIVPVIGQAVQKLLFAPVTALVSKLDKIKQAQEVRNIQALGNIEEMNRAASNAAGLMTLYYSAQITNIDLSNTSSTSNNKIVLLAKGTVSPGEVKIGMDTVSTSQHTHLNNGVVKFAEFAVYWIIKYLKSGQVIPEMPLAEQLWFAVASHNPYASKSVTDKLGKGAGSTKVTLKSGKAVEIRMLYAGVQVVTNDGSVYRPKGVIPEGENGSSEIGYVHVNAFATKTMSDAIIQNRKLYKEEHAKSNPMNETLSKQVQVFRSNIETSTEIRGSSTTPGIGFEQQKMASTVGDYLKKSGDMIGEQQVKDLVKQTFAEAQVSLECEVDVLREELKQKTEYYQTSIDAATETIAKEIGACKAETKSLQQQQRAYSEEHINKLTAIHQQTINDMNKEHAEHLAERQKAYETLHANMQSQVQQLQNNAEQQLKSVTEKYQQMIRQLSEELTAVTKASEAKAAAAEKTAAEARTTCQHVMETCSKQKQEWDAERKMIIETHQKLIQEQTQAFESVTSTTKTALKEQSNIAKEAAEQAKVLAKNAKEEVAIAQKLAKEEAGRAKEAVNAAERAASAAKDAMSQAKKAQESATSALDKVNKRASGPS